MTIEEVNRILGRRNVSVVIPVTAPAKAGAAPRKRKTLKAKLVKLTKPRPETNK